MDLKLAEKLTLLQKHGQGLLTRLWHTKKTFKEDKPQFMADKGFESATKSAMKKFPNVSFPKAPDNPVFAKREEIFAALFEHYGTLVDVLEFKSHFDELITTISSTQSLLDFSINTIETAAYFNLLRTYMSVMMLLNRLDDRKLIAGCFNAVHIFLRGEGDNQYPRLGTLLVEYENPVKRIQEDFLPNKKILMLALKSLFPFLCRRLQTANDYRKNNILELLHDPTSMAVDPSEKDMLANMTSSEALVHWVIFGVLAVPESILEFPEILGCAKMALSTGFVMELHRTETFSPHTALEELISGIRDKSRFSKVKGFISESLVAAVGDSLSGHADMRRYLRQALSRLLHIFSDKPAIMGPKVHLLLEAVQLGRDEVTWLFRHMPARPPKTKAKMNPNLLKDSELPHLIFLLVELNSLVREHRPLLSQYFAKSLKSFDRSGLENSVAGLRLSDLQHTIIDSFKQQMDSLSPDSPQQDMRGFRLDWLRLQCGMACRLNPADRSCPLADNKNLAQTMNAAWLHSQFIDNSEAFMRENALPLIPWFYRKTYIKMFERALASISQLRYSVAFIQMMDAFCFAASPSVPAEISDIGRSCANAAMQLLGNLADHIYKVSNKMALLHVRLADDTAFGLYAKTAEVEKTNKKGAPVEPAEAEIRTQLATHHQTIADLCWAMNHKLTFPVFCYNFCPREFVKKRLEEWFGSGLRQLMQNHPDGQIIRPSRLLTRVKAFLASIRSVESYLNIEVTSVFSTGLLEQTEVMDKAHASFATDYAAFYTQLVYTQAANNSILFSETRNCFVSKASSTVPSEGFTDANELQCLCLLLGPIGIQELHKRLIGNLTKSLQEIKKVVVGNARALGMIAQGLGNAADCLEAIKTIKDCDEYINRMSFVGAVLHFKQALNDSLRLVLESRIPFVFHAIEDLHEFAPTSETVAQLAATAGLSSQTDPLLVRVCSTLLNSPETDFATWNLTMVMAGVCLRHIAIKNPSYRPELEAFDNNCHCMALAITEVSSCLFSLSASNLVDAPRFILNGQQELLKVASVLLLRLGTDKDREIAKGKDGSIAILQKFVETAPLMTANMFEAHLPYTLVRQAYSSLYMRRAGRGKKIEETNY